MLKKFLITFFAMFLSFCLVLMSAFLDTTNVESYEQLANVRFGFPVPFIQQDILKSGTNGFEGTFPHRFKMQADFLDADPSIDVLVVNFLGSVVIVFGVLMFSFTLLHKLWIRKK